MPSYYDSTKKDPKKTKKVKGYKKGGGTGRAAAAAKARQASRSGPVRTKRPEEMKRLNEKLASSVKGLKKGGKVFASSGAPVPKKTVARGSGAARKQYFRKNG